MRLTVAEDSTLFREGLLRLLAELGHDVVAAAGDAVSAVRDAHELSPDVALLDIRMPPDLESDGARAAAELRRTKPEVAVLLLSQHVELRHCLPLIGTPGFGYLLKDRVLDLAEFDQSLHRIASGGVALDPLVVQALVQDQPGPSALDSLTAREQEVLEAVAQGQTNHAIAAALNLSERTVEAHLRSVFTKLNLHDDGATHRRVRAVVTYLESGPPIITNRERRSHP